MGNKKTITLPEPSEELAEFVGAFLGDGNIASDFQAFISFNLKTERRYADHLAQLIWSLFRLEVGT